jgi:hypothetical protein
MCTVAEGRVLAENSMSKNKSLFAVLLAVGAAFVAVAPAQATPFQWSVSIGAPIAIYPAPVIVRQAPVVVRPAYRAAAYQQPTRWDHDGDRIPNRHDHLYNPRWDVDGDGVPNRHDRHDDRYRRGR